MGSQSEQRFLSNSLEEVKHLTLNFSTPKFFLSFVEVLQKNWAR